MSLQINKRTEGDTVLLEFVGKLDTHTAPQVEAAVAALPDDVRSVDMDFSKVRYVASAGIRELLRAAKRCDALGGSLRIIHPSAMALEPFGISNLALVLNIVE